MNRRTRQPVAGGASREVAPSGLGNDGSAAVSLLVAGPVLYAGIGYALDELWLGTGYLTGLGLLLGAVLSGVMFYRRYRELS